MTGPQFRERHPMPPGDPNRADAKGLFIVFGSCALLCCGSAAVLWIGLMKGWW
jgi:hypothetical protein